MWLSFLPAYLFFHAMISSFPFSQLSSLELEITHSCLIPIALIVPFLGIALLLLMSVVGQAIIQLMSSACFSLLASIGALACSVVVLCWSPWWSSTAWLHFCWWSSGDRLGAVDDSCGWEEGRTPHLPCDHKVALSVIPILVAGEEDSCGPGMMQLLQKLHPESSLSCGTCSSY